MPMYKHLSSHIAHFMRYNRRKWKPLIGWNRIAQCHRVLMWLIIHLIFHLLTEDNYAIPISKFSIKPSIIMLIVWCSKVIYWLLGVLSFHLPRQPRPVYNIRNIVFKWWYTSSCITHSHCYIKALHYSAASRPIISSIVIFDLNHLYSIRS